MVACGGKSAHSWGAAWEMGLGKRERDPFRISSFEVRESSDPDS